MTEYVHLIGTEQIQSAGYAMRDAAAEMNRAAGNFDEVLNRHRLFMDEWLARFEQILTDNRP